MKFIIIIAVCFFSISAMSAMLPLPTAVPQKSQKLSLQDAIALALRTNSGVQISELQRILDKFGLETVIHSYGVQWTAPTLTSQLQNGVPPQWSASTGIAVNAPSGTSVGITQSNNFSGGVGNTQLQVTQHLLRGFGFAVNRVNYQDALDKESVAKLNFKNSVITTVVTVISNYRALVASENSLKINRQTLASQEESVMNSKLRVDAGQLAPSELLQQEATVENTRLGVVQQEDALRNSYQTFLSSLGMPADKKIIVDRHIALSHETIPSLQACIDTALKNNIAYQQALLTLQVTKRTLITAEDARKWQLDAQATTTVGSQLGQPINSIGSTAPTVLFTLSVPFDNISLKQAVVSAKIAIEDAEINLRQQKEDLIRSVMNQYATIQNQAQQIDIAKQSVQMQEKTVLDAKLKLKYGRVSVFEVDTLEDQLLAQRLNLVTTEINYLNAVTALHQILGSTLHNWHIHLRY
ncbi:MAG: hypothetical protein A3I77_00870 [Gammaproteobacteria bacterium RIFCSPLOWO2_02_FULL_42_14]|nr:MAG: hypothetical protein A3E54_08520 [Gammaproteobacteria bacterium RIFCSPHIGHO2_12_FULL_41_25]OGT60983.1 MAG: hypothetical protein A3I77_00870 [Gammaproteobacteria bacterium RIFCSPLOWO2_02_FULL_42_14]OGT85299.1 MAG: hypothetical protein A3G86_05505 [Gammaproteobacteria bacterium RIFCSPLOWO2_12_FULL_42_18]